MAAQVLMIQGTSSSAGKSLLSAALCRIFWRRGRRVAPFKAQNMSNNAAVCGDGAEIGRAQAVQAAAAGIAPSADMNPILLKPEADARSQVVVLGRPWQTLAAGSYYRRKDELWPIVTAALDRLRSQCDLVIVEGAGSPVELNLRSTDIVNMAVARHARCPVLLVGDIDRGGIFAQLLGTLNLFEDAERALVGGLIVNKFRGDRRLFDDGVRILEERGQVPVLGVIPYLPDLAIPEEDAVALDGVPNEGSGAGIDVAVIKLPHIANFDDFDPLGREPGVRLRYVDSVEELGRPAAIILPGTKSTLADLDWLGWSGLADAIRRLAAEGTAVVGICGGFQMLGARLRDPDHVESPIADVEGLGLLPMETLFETTKATHQVEGKVIGATGWLTALAGQTLTGYEIHMGRSSGGTNWLELRRPDGVVQDGAMSADGQLWGCYLHGLFANDRFRRAWLASLQSSVAKPTDSAPWASALQASFDRLADAVEQALDMERLIRIIDSA